jgi:hypothetical protein
MNSIAILSLFALTTTGLALIHETRLRRAVRNIACHLIQALRHHGRAHDHARDVK